MPTNINGNTGIDKVQDGTVVSADIDTLDASKLTGSIAAARIANNTIDSAHIASGAVDDAHLATGITASKLTGALPAISAANLTAIPAANITGTLPAISGANLTGLSSGLYASVALICDQKAYNTHGGTFTSGAWRTRDLNTEIYDGDSIVSISSNQFTLAAGTYTIEWTCPGRNLNRHITQLYNATDTAVLQYGACTYPSSGGGGDYGDTSGRWAGTIAGTKAFEIRGRCQTTAATQGFGLDSNEDATGVSIYTTVIIYKHS